MIQEPETLYKLMVLYMLDSVSFPLTNSQLSGFFLSFNYTTYFTLQRVINDLAESGMISSRQVGNSTHYEIESDGREALSFFKNDISPAARADMDKYMEENKFRMRSEVSVTADYLRSPIGYTVHCVVREGGSVLLSVDISVPDEKTASEMCLNWNTKCQSIYSNIMMELMNLHKD